MTFIIVLTDDCNLKCSYCFEHNKQATYMKSKDIPVIISFMKKYLNEDFLFNNKEITISFNGGEAMMNFSVLKELYFELKNNFNNITYYTISTNLTLLDDEKLEFLYRNEIVPHISIDGVKKIHNLYRIYRSGKGTFDDIYANILKIRNKYPEWNCSYTMTFTPQTVNKLFEGFMMLRNLGITRIGVAPVLDLEWEEKDYKILKRELKKIKDEIIKSYNENKKIYFKMLHEAINNSIKGITDCGICNDLIVILPTGEILPCPSFIGLSDYKEFVVGNINGFLNYDLITKLIKKENLDLEECKECVLLSRCQNKCPAINYRVHKDINIIPANYCRVNQICLLEADTIVDHLCNTKNKIFFEEYPMLKEIIKN